MILGIPESAPVKNYSIIRKPFSAGQTGKTGFLSFLFKRKEAIYRITSFPE